MTTVGIIGAGYVGLTTGACLSHLGHDVVCGDIDAAKVEALRSGHVPILEAGLDELVARGLADGTLRFEHGARATVAGRAVVFLCVPTPQHSDGSADLSYLRAAAAEIAEALEPGAVVVNKSTVPVGSTVVVEAELDRSDIVVLSNPEFLREGTAVGDFLDPDRIVVGGRDPAAARLVASLYRGLEDRVMITSAPSAEAIKYAANAFLATKISFTNAVAALCEVVGADVEEVLRGLGSDRRIGSEFLRPGPGWGGSCFPKDTRALLRMARDNGFNFNLLEGVISANEDQFDRITQKVARSVGGSLAGSRIGVWGLTFKAGTNDLRESPSLAIVRRLLDQGSSVVAYDPTTTGSPRGFETMRLVETALDAATDVDVLVVLTEWPEFANIDPARVAARMSSRRVVDGRNLLDRDRWSAAGFEYQGVGR